MPDTFLVGELARLSVRIVDIDGEATDPATLTVLTISPSGELTEEPSGAIIKDATGAYHYDLPLSKPGRWYYRWETSAPAAGAAEGQITVYASRFK